MGITVRRADVATIFGLRHAVLRAGLPESAARDPRDGEPDTAHFAAFDGGRLAGCVTIYPETIDDQPAWRLRGMAVAGAAQKLGVGRLLLAAVDRHVEAAAGPGLVWCNARLPAVGFYERCGWTAVSGVYDIPTAGPHRKMTRRVRTGLEIRPAISTVAESNQESGPMPISVTIWHEHRHEKKHKAVSDMYPEGMHGQLAKHLRSQEGLEVALATLDDPEHGLTDAVIAGTDVMIWWGHGYHAEVADAIVDKVHKRCLAGMGLIVLHSAHYSKIFRRLMGTTCDLKWRVAEDREILWVTKPGHPILAGIDDHFVLDKEEMYGEYFDVPEPQETLLISTFSGGECFRSGLTWQRGAGKIFYFRPGHETYRSYYDPNVLRVITNAVRWACPVEGGKVPSGSVNKPKPGWA